jgi:hypothetical protein
MLIVYVQRHTLILQNEVYRHIWRDVHIRHFKVLIDFDVLI